MIILKIFAGFYYFSHHCAAGKFDEIRNFFIFRRITASPKNNRFLRKSEAFSEISEEFLFLRRNPTIFFWENSHIFSQQESNLTFNLTIASRAICCKGSNSPANFLCLLVAHSSHISHIFAHFAHVRTLFAHFSHVRTFRTWSHIVRTFRTLSTIRT